MARKPNCGCTVCGTPIYRRPWELEKFKKVFCSPACRGESRRTYYHCPGCFKDFFLKSKGRNGRKYCSIQCANRSRRGSKYSKRKTRTQTEYNINKIKEHYDFKECMVDGCNYNRTFDIHRFLEGKNGGKYEIGNMFAICPNHHQEYHRKIIRFEKIDNFTLKAYDI